MFFFLGGGEEGEGEGVGEGEGGALLLVTVVRYGVISIIRVVFFAVGYGTIP